MNGRIRLRTCLPVAKRLNRESAGSPWPQWTGDQDSCSPREPVPQVQRAPRRPNKQLSASCPVFTRIFSNSSGSHEPALSNDVDLKSPTLSSGGWPITLRRDAHSDLQGGDHFRRREILIREPTRIEPDAHAVFPGLKMFTSPTPSTRSSCLCTCRVASC